MSRSVSTLPESVSTTRRSAEGNLERKGENVEPLQEYGPAFRREDEMVVAALRDSPQGYPPGAMPRTPLPLRLRRRGAGDHAPRRIHRAGWHDAPLGQPGQIAYRPRRRGLAGRPTVMLISVATSRTAFWGAALAGRRLEGRHRRGLRSPASTPQGRWRAGRRRAWSWPH